MHYEARRTMVQNVFSEEQFHVTLIAILLIVIVIVVCEPIIFRTCALFLSIGGANIEIVFFSSKFAFS